MYLRKITKRHAGKTHTHYVLVESVYTPKGPRQKVVCSLGGLEPRPRSGWLKLVQHVEQTLSGDPLADCPGSIPGKVTVESVRPAGPIHAVLEYWRRLQIDGLFQELGLSDRTAGAACLLTLHRMFCPSPLQGARAWAAATAVSDILPSILTVRDAELDTSLRALYGKRSAFERGLMRRHQSLSGADSQAVFGCLTTYPAGDFDRSLAITFAINSEGLPIAHHAFAASCRHDATVEGCDFLRTLRWREPRMLLLNPAVTSEHTRRCLREWGFVASARYAGAEAIRRALQGDKGRGYSEFRRPGRTAAGLKHNLRLRSRHAGDRTEMLIVDQDEQRIGEAALLRQEHRLLQGLQELRDELQTGWHPSDTILDSIRTLLACCPEAGEAYSIDYDRQTGRLEWTRNEVRWAAVAAVSGADLYIFDELLPLRADSLWSTLTACLRTTRVLAAMDETIQLAARRHRSDKTGLRLDLLIALLAAHLRFEMERDLADARGAFSDWDAAMETLSSHFTATVVLPEETGDMWRLRVASRPEPRHLRIYRLLSVTPLWR